MTRDKFDGVSVINRVAGVDSAPGLLQRMRVDGTLADTVSRQVRWTRTALYVDPNGLALGATVPLVVTLGTLLAPVFTVPLVALLAGLAYAACGLRRWTFLLAAPGYVLLFALLCYGLVRREFVWTGRRYRWTGLYDVTVLERDVG